MKRVEIDSILFAEENFEFESVAPVDHSICVRRWVRYGRIDRILIRERSNTHQADVILPALRVRELYEFLKTQFETEVKP